MAPSVPDRERAALPDRSHPDSPRVDSPRVDSPRVDSPRFSAGAISLEQVGKSFDRGQTFAVDDVSLEVPSGQTLVLLGSSGSGKTTLLKAINRLHEIDRGRIVIDGVDIAPLDVVQLRRQIGYVFQGIGLFPHHRVIENVETVPRLLGWSRRRRRKRARELLDLIGLPPQTFADRYPDELSGGQRQRVGVARALAADPNIILMDEPFGALDAVVRERLQEEVLRIGRELGKTMIIVTHDLFEAITLGDRIAVMHDGRLHQHGTPAELMHRPATDFVRQLIQTPRRLLERMDAELGDLSAEPSLRGTRVVTPADEAAAIAGEVA